MGKGGIHETVLRLVGKTGDGHEKSASAGAAPSETMDKTAALIRHLRNLAEEDGAVEKPASGLQEKVASLAGSKSETAVENQGSQLLLARIHALSEDRAQVKSAAAKEADESASPQEGASTPDVRSKLRSRLLSIVNGKEGDA